MSHAVSIVAAAWLFGCGGNDEVEVDPNSAEGQSFFDDADTPTSGGNATPGTAEDLIDGADPVSGVGATPGGAVASDEDCTPNFTGLVRDFQASHPDFQVFSGREISPGIVEEDLGGDKKPVYNESGPNMVDLNGEKAYFQDPADQEGQQTTSKANFDQWYRDTPGVNLSTEFELPFNANGTSLIFESDAFFPIDDELFGNEGNDHNFWFTFELHMQFTYSGGEEFTFTGDDDVWVFINNKLAVDVGGLHPAESASVDLDAEAARLGITPGHSYDLDLFHAERKTNRSNFRVETSIAFTNCDPIFVQAR